MENQLCFRSGAGRHADCCKNNCVPYSIFFCSLSLDRGSGTEIASRAASRAARNGTHRLAGCCKNNCVPYSFFAQHRGAAARRRRRDPHCGCLRYGATPPSVARRFAYLIRFFHRLAGWVSNSPPAPNASVAIPFGRGRRLERALFLWRLFQSFPTIGFAGQSIPL
jgi:hypothetical protein